MQWWIEFEWWFYRRWNVLVSISTRKQMCANAHILKPKEKCTDPDPPGKRLRHAQISKRSSLRNCIQRCPNSAHAWQSNEPLIVYRNISTHVHIYIYMCVCTYICSNHLIRWPLAHHKQHAIHAAVQEFDMMCSWKKNFLRSWINRVKNGIQLS